MKISSLFPFLIAFVLIGVSIVPGQTLELRDLAELPNCEYLLRTLEVNTLDVVNDKDQPNGHVILHPGRNPIENAQYEKYIRRYIVRLKLQDRIFLHITEPSNKLKIEFWRGNAGIVPTFRYWKTSRDLKETTKPILFDSDLFEMFVENGKKHFVGVNCAACCISSLDWFLLSEFIDANPTLRVYVVIRGNRSRHLALRNHVQAELADAGISGTIIKYLFSGKNLVNSRNFSEVAVFLSAKTINSANSLRGDFDNY